MKFQTIALALTSLSLVACGKFSEKFGRINGGQTVVEITGHRNSLAPASTLTGGVMVYATRASDGYKQAIVLASETDAKEMVLPNGSYTFSAVGWLGANLAGSPRCAKPTAPYGLNGARTTIAMNLTASNCDDDYFGSAANSFRAGAALNPWKFKFCGGSVDLTSLAAADDCGQTRESYRFFKGRTGGGQEPEAEIDSTTNRFVYLTPQHNSVRKELFSVGLDGKATVKQSSATSHGNIDVKQFALVPGKGEVLYIANQDTAAKYELYRSTIAVPGGRRISSASFTQVRKMAVSPDGNYVVLVGELSASGKNEVFSINLMSETMVKISDASPTGNGVDDMSGEFHFAITPNSERVVYTGRFPSSAKREIFAAPIFTANSAVLLSGGAPSATFMVDRFLIVNNTYVVWAGDYHVTSRRDVFRAEITGAANNSQQVSTGAAFQGTQTETFTLSPNKSYLLYAAETGTTNRFDLLSAQVDQVTLPAPVVVHASTTTQTQYYNLAFSSNSARVAYYSDAATDGVFKIYRAPTTTAGQEQDRTHTSADSMPYSTGGGGGDGKPIHFSPDGNYIFYRGHTTANTGEYGIYKASYASGSGTLISQAPATGKLVPNFSLGAGRIYFPYDDTTAGVKQLFTYDLTSSSLSEIVPPAGTVGNISSTHYVHDEASFLNKPNSLAFAGSPQSGSMPQDIYYLPDISAPSSVVKLTHQFDSAAGIGRFRIRLLAYKTDPAGNLVDTQEGLSSACLNGPATDGAPVDLATPDLRVPAGNGSNGSPFALAIDIYGEASDCSGTPSRILLPKGAANLGASLQSAKLRIAIDGGVPAFFVKD